ncbi:MAG TPA: type II/IV secretion system protein, partial [Bacteroidia bacterium]|nr:type II/IV secretion system protein [Bacteroidia bacterium]
PYLLAATIRLVVAQRLLRRLCESCKIPGDQQLAASTLARYGISQHYAAVGCPTCHYTGYTQRRAIYEVLPIDKTLTTKIKTLEQDIDSYLQEKGIMTLRDQVVTLIRNGETSLEEGLTFLI